MAITVNLRYTGKKGAAQAFAREMISNGTVEKIRAEKGHKIDAIRNYDKASFCVYDSGYRKERD